MDTKTQDTKMKDLLGQNKGHDGYSSRTSGGVLRVENLSVAHGASTILLNVSLEVPAGEMHVVIGPNGSGKTTLLKAIIGEIRYTGRIRALDAEGKEIRPCIGYVPQKLEFDPESPVSVLDLFGAGYARWPVWLGHTRSLRNRVKQSLDRVDAAHLLTRPLGQLSGGELQRVLLALALDPLPDILLLDEPFSNVDQSGMEKYYELIAGFVRESRGIALLVSHDLAAAGQFAQKMLFLDHTIEAFGTPGEVLADENFRRVFSNFSAKNSNNLVS